MSRYQETYMYFLLENETIQYGMGCRLTCISLRPVFGSMIDFYSCNEPNITYPAQSIFQEIFQEILFAIKCRVARWGYTQYTIKKLGQGYLVYNDFSNAYVLRITPIGQNHVFMVNNQLRPDPEWETTTQPMSYCYSKSAVKFMYISITPQTRRSLGPNSIDIIFFSILWRKNVQTAHCLKTAPMFYVK